MLWFAWLASLAFAEDGWVVADAEILRWQDKAHVGAKLVRGDAVDVLLHDGANVRVRKGTDFGWMAAANVSTTEVVKLPEFPVEFSLPGAGLPPGLSFSAPPPDIASPPPSK